MTKEISLLSLKTNQEAKIVKINGGSEAIKRLSDLGLTPNTKIKILRKAIFGGPIEVEVRRSRFSLGRGLALKILVEVE
jgi:ferrous iron transport protein A